MEEYNLRTFKIWNRNNRSWQTKVKNEYKWLRNLSKAPEICQKREKKIKDLPKDERNEENSSFVDKLSAFSTWQWQPQWPLIIAVIVLNIQSETNSFCIGQKKEDFR